jgi:hypothetical protein
MLEACQILLTILCVQVSPMKLDLRSSGDRAWIEVSEGAGRMTVDIFDDRRGRSAPTAKHCVNDACVRYRWRETRTGRETKIDIVVASSAEVRRIAAAGRRAGAVENLLRRMSVRAEGASGVYYVPINDLPRS